MTMRSVVIGLLLLIAAAITITYNDYGYSNTYLSGGNHFPIIAVFVIVVFSFALNPGLKLLEPRWVFSQKEMIVIWCMMAAGVGIPASGLMRYLLPFMIAPFYFAAPGDKWTTTFYDFIPDWLVPSKDVNSPIVTMFYQSARDEAIPWRAWVTPFFGWGIVVMAAYLMMFCMTAIIRKQWVEHERLSFPLARIPLEISMPPERGRYLNALLRSPVTWVGAGIPIFFWTLAGLNNLYSNVPAINSLSWPLTNLLSELQGWNGMVRFYFMPIGVAFLLSTEVSLSLWLFFVLHNVQRITRESFGYGIGEGEFESKQQLGGFIAFAAIALWTMRRHLKDVLRKAFLGAKDVDDSREALSYRGAVFGLIVSSAAIVGWLGIIGCPPWISVFYLLVVGVVLLVLSRFVAQCGLLLVQTSLPGGPLGVVQDFVPNSFITAKGLTAVTLYQSGLYGDTREVMMPTLLNNTKMGENRLNLKKLFLAMMLAVLVSYTVSYFSQVIGYYQFGANSVAPNYSVDGYPKGTLNRLTSDIEGIEKQSDDFAFARGDLKHIVAGGAAVALVYLLRSRLTWWFVHPIGVLTAQTYPLRMLWLSILIGWLCKFVAQRYARGPMMAKIRNLFLGLIIGDALITIFWAMLGLVLGENMGVGSFVT